MYVYMYIIQHVPLPKRGSGTPQRVPPSTQSSRVLLAATSARSSSPRQKTHIFHRSNGGFIVVLCWFYGGFMVVLWWFHMAKINWLVVLWWFYGDLIEDLWWILVDL